MRPRSHSGGRHELGQNFLTHRPTLRRMSDLAAQTEGSILEIGSGDGALTRHLAALGRDLVAVDIDRRRVDRLRARLPGVTAVHADALAVPFDRAVIVGNVPFHLTTPILRRLLQSPGWRHAILLTQWEVARKRAGVGGSTMMTAQASPWFAFTLHGRVPARHFRPMPVVDGGILSVRRRPTPLVDMAERHRFESFVGDLFRHPGNGMRQILRRAGFAPGVADLALRSAGVDRAALPRDLDPEQWAALWRGLRGQKSAHRRPIDTGGRSERRDRRASRGGGPRPQRRE